MLVVVLLFMQRVVAAGGYLEDSFYGSDCLRLENAQARRVQVANCIANCLALDFYSKESCSYNASTGKLIVKYENTDYETASMICGIIWPNARHWLPKNWDEVRCVIEALPEEIQKIGKLRIVVYKSDCSKEFFLCTTDTPRSLQSSFLAAELNKTQTIFPNATCASFDFSIAKKKVTDVQLRVADCKEKTFVVCEHV